MVHSRQRLERNSKICGRNTEHGQGTGPCIAVDASSIKDLHCKLRPSRGQVNEPSLGKKCRYLQLHGTFVISWGRSRGDRYMYNSYNLPGSCRERESHARKADGQSEARYAAASVRSRFLSVAPTATGPAPSSSMWLCPTLTLVVHESLSTSGARVIRTDKVADFVAPMVPPLPQGNRHAALNSRSSTGTGGDSKQFHSQIPAFAAIS